MKLRLMTDYECHPLWEILDGGSARNVAVEDLELSAGLVRELRAWASRYDETLNRDDPAASGFDSDEDELEFERTGRRLRAALADELGPNVKVTYFSEIEQRELED